MKRFMVLMHSDTIDPERGEDWEPYLERLRRSGRFDGGSSLGRGIGHRRRGQPAPVADHVVGYLLVRGVSADDIAELLAGNPVYEAGGTVEIHELLVD